MATLLGRPRVIVDSDSYDSYNVVTRNKVYDPDTLSWVNMTQPLVSTDTLTVTMSGVATAAHQVTQNTALSNLLTELQLKADLTEIQPVQEPDRALRFDDSANPILYLGAAEPGSATASAVWRIQRFDVTSGVTSTFADGNDNFDNVWNNRAALSYS